MRAVAVIEDEDPTAPLGPAGRPGLVLTRPLVVLGSASLGTEEVAEVPSRRPATARGSRCAKVPSPRGAG